MFFFQSADTHGTDTHTVTDAIDHPAHASVTAGVANHNFGRTCTVCSLSLPQTTARSSHALLHKYATNLISFNGYGYFQVPTGTFQILDLEKFRHDASTFAEWYNKRRRWTAGLSVVDNTGRRATVDDDRRLFVALGIQLCIQRDGHRLQLHWFDLLYDKSAANQTNGD